MRGLDTNVKRIRRKVFKEIARVGFESEPETLVADIEAIPYHIVFSGRSDIPIARRTRSLATALSL